MNQGCKINQILRPFSLVALLAFCLCPVVAWAEATQFVEETAQVARVIDGDTLVLTDGRHVRLDAVNALEIPHRAGDEEKCLPSTRLKRTPQIHLGSDKDFGCDLTLAQAARSKLEQLTNGKTIRLQINPERRDDRYGRLLAQIIVKDAAGGDVSVAEQLLADGLVHVYPLSGQEMGTRHLLVLENKAREQKLGIWRLPELQVTPAAQAGTQYGHYALIAGRVVNAHKSKTKIFLNFGQDYHKDFSVSIDKRDWKNFSVMDVMALQNKTILVRGYLHEDYGPALRLTNEGQITLLP